MGFDRVDLDSARIIAVRILPRGVGAITLGRVVLMRRTHLRDVTLLHHELVHVRQWREHGAMRFLTRYVGAYLRFRLAGCDHRRAYLAIPAEVEARAAAGR